MRHERTSPLPDELGQWIADTYQELRPKSPLAEAVDHTMRQWTALRRVLEEGRIPLDNGELERRLRDVAMGRRNDLFAGSDTGAERAAAACWSLGGCALDGVEPWAYPDDVMQRIVDGRPMSRLAELLPANYAATVEAESRPRRAARPPGEPTC